MRRVRNFLPHVVVAVLTLAAIVGMGIVAGNPGQKTDIKKPVPTAAAASYLSDHPSYGADEGILITSYDKPYICTTSDCAIWFGDVVVDSTGTQVQLQGYRDVAVGIQPGCLVKWGTEAGVVTTLTPIRCGIPNTSGS